MTWQILRSRQSYWPQISITHELSVYIYSDTYTRFKMSISSIKQGRNCFGISPAWTSTPPLFSSSMYLQPTLNLCTQFLWCSVLWKPSSQACIVLRTLSIYHLASSCVFRNCLQQVEFLLKLFSSKLIIAAMLRSRYFWSTENMKTKAINAETPQSIDNLNSPILEEKERLCSSFFCARMGSNYR